MLKPTDTEMLDWLDSQGKEASIRLGASSGVGDFKVVKAWAISAHPQLTLREAIRATMEHDAKQGKTP